MGLPTEGFLTSQYAAASWRTPPAHVMRHLVSAQVVVATCAGAGDPRLKDRTFRMLVIDEATQATEPMTLIPLVRTALSI